MLKLRIELRKTRKNHRKQAKTDQNPARTRRSSSTIRHENDNLDPATAISGQTLTKVT
jgi:hypothetical protein